MSKRSEILPTEFLTRNSRLPIYMPYPKFLLDSGMNETTQLLYVLLYDRARLSMQNHGWTDAQGRVYIYFSIQSMALALGKSETTVKHALSVLVQQGLIVRVRQSVGRASRIYVKIIAGAENDSQDSQKTAGHAGEILPTNKNIGRKTKKKEAANYTPKSGRLETRSYDCSEEESL